MQIKQSIQTGTGNAKISLNETLVSPVSTVEISRRPDDNAHQSDSPKRIPATKDSTDSNVATHTAKLTEVSDAIKGVAKKLRADPRRARLTVRPKARAKEFDEENHRVVQ